MAFETEVIKQQADLWVELYKIQVGNELIFFTSHHEPVYFLGDTYLARPISRTAFSLTSDFSPINITITAPVEAPFSQFVVNYPVNSVRVQIYFALKADPDNNYKLIFSGRVKGVEIEDFNAKVSVESLTDRLKNKLPRFIFQAFCNHRLYDGGCKLVEGDYKTPAVITIAGSTLVSASFATKPDGWFQWGRIRPQGKIDERLITSHVGSVITLQVPFAADVLVDGDTVDAFAGCDKAPGTCASKFNNSINFLGFPHIPSKNIAVVGW